MGVLNKIILLCEKSTDPFFHDELLPMIKDCEVREDLIKSYKVLRESSNSIGELTDAEELFQEVNEEMWEDLKDAAEKYFSKESITERFIEITSDTFDIPNLPKEFRSCSKAP